MSAETFARPEEQVSKSSVQEMISKRLVHEVHTSERKSFRGCRRRWHWVFQEFYYPKTTAKPLEFGVAFHNAMETIYNPDTWTWDRQIVKNAAINVFVKTCENQKKKYLEEVNEQYMTNEEAETDYEERVKLGIGMINYYVNDVAPLYDEGWKPVKVEIEFIVPIQNPDTNEYLFCTCPRCRKTFLEYCASQSDNESIDFALVSSGDGWTISVNGQGHLPWKGLVVTLAGRIDMLAEDPNGRLWLVDWKTAARLARGDASGQDRDEFLELDDQIGSYVMALTRKLNLDVVGFVYVELKKAFPEEPLRNKQPRLGRWYSVNKQQSVDYKTYLKTVQENDPLAYEEGLYDEFLTYLKEEGINFHGRYQISKTWEELEEIERNLFYEAADMTDQSLRIYPSAGRFNCGFCAFRGPCIEKNRKGDYQYMLDTLFEKREKHYWVRELSTDKTGGE